MSTTTTALPAEVAGTAPERRILPLTVATPETFARYGQVILPAEDGTPFGPDDARLDLSRGVPRFYAMQLHHRGNVFRQITRHRRVTQCLGSMMGVDWMVGVAAPDPDSDAPSSETLAAFLIPGDRFIKLHVGTWHAGPYFAAPSAVFYNLELSDTNVTDHQTCDLAELWDVDFEFGAPPAGRGG